jgi:hypothetical protein
MVSKDEECDAGFEAIARYFPLPVAGFSNFKCSSVLNLRISERLILARMRSVGERYIFNLY